MSSWFSADPIVLYDKIANRWLISQFGDARHVRGAFDESGRDRDLCSLRLCHAARMQSRITRNSGYGRTPTTCG